MRKWLCIKLAKQPFLENDFTVAEKSEKCRAVPPQIWEAEENKSRFGKKAKWVKCPLYSLADL